MEITLTAQEGELVRLILDQHYTELLREIARTDSRDFRADLKEKAKLLESLITKLRMSKEIHQEQAG